MKAKILWILVLFLVVGCNLHNKFPLDYNTEFIPNRSEPKGVIEITYLEINETPECIDDFECDVLWKDEICKNNKCIEVECRKDYDCLDTFWYSLTRGYDMCDCINYTCVSLKDDCIKIAKLDYSMNEPHCTYKGNMECWCEDRIILSKERTMNKTNSVQIIPENWKFSDVIQFKISGAR